MNKQRKTKEQHRKLASLLAKGIPVTKAMVQAGWSETQAAKGWAKVPDAVINSLPRSAQRLISLGRGTDKETRKDIVRGRLIDNALKGKDGGAMSAKILGQDSELNMFVPELQQGLIVLNLPQNVNARDLLSGGMPESES